MLTFEFIVFGVLMSVLSVSTAYLFFKNDQETKTARVGYLIVALGFALYSIGLFATIELTRALATFIIGSGIITCGIGYPEKVPKWIHIGLGITIYGVMLTRFVL